MRIVLYYLCGVFAAAQLGKLAALAPLISGELRLGLATTAALTSLLEVCGATLGGAAGHWLPRLGLRRALSLALLALVAGSAGAAFAADLPVLALARLVESLGYLGVVVAAPVLIARAAHGRRQAGAMALWSTFVPVGMAVGAFSFAACAQVWSWRGAQGLSVAAGLALWAALRLADRGPDPHAVDDGVHPRQRTGAALWMLVAAFGAYAIAEVGLLALLPSLLTLGGMTLATAGGWTALAALANVPASALGAALLRRRGASSGWIAAAMALSLGLSALLYLVVMRDGGAPGTQALGAIGVNLASGVFPSLVFALLPLVAGRPERLSLASGRLTQFGASGALLGPPLVGAVVQHLGWTAAGALCLTLSLLAVPLAVGAWRRMGAAASIARIDAATRPAGDALR